MGPDCFLFKGIPCKSCLPALWPGFSESWPCAYGAWVFNTHVAHITMVMLLSLHGFILKLSYLIVGFFLPFLRWMMLPNEPLSGPNDQPFGDCI